MFKSVNWAKVVAAIILAAATIIAAWVGKEKPVPPESTGQIVSPKPGEPVSQSFRVSGEFFNIPEGSHVWLAVESGNLLWIKEPELRTSDRRWSMNVVEGGNPPGFSLSLLQVSSEGQRVIENWLNHGENTGEYPSMSLDSIPNAKRLDMVEGLRLR